ncbi:MAG: Glycerate kinase [Verrucomicrobia bacterium]|nr:Glycerate kinase [Verrucomicrobiota bacterium]
MRVLIVFDKFKDSMSAGTACLAAAESLRARHPDWELDVCPLADGGEGFVEILTAAAGGTLEAQTVSGPRGAPVNAAYGLVPVQTIPMAARAMLQLPGVAEDARIAVIEMAAASGLALLSSAERDPWRATSTGTGELIAAATAAGAAALLLGVGGSATHDLGLGALAALGLRFRSQRGEGINPPIPSDWAKIERIEGNLPAGLPPVRIACDVSNPLLGARGAAAVYGPQKGLRPADLAKLDSASARLALMLCARFGRSDSLMDEPGAGAAGGIAFGLMASAGAALLPGFDLVAAWLGLETRIAAADFVITGEGRFDDSSLEGKGPGAIAARALDLGKPVHVFAGQVTTRHARPGLALHAITPANEPLGDALRNGRASLAAAVSETFRNLNRS